MAVVVVVVVALCWLLVVFVVAVLIIFVFVVGGGFVNITYLHTTRKNKHKKIAVFYSPASES